MLFKGFYPGETIFDRIILDQPFLEHIGHIFLLDQTELLILHPHIGELLSLILHLLLHHLVLFELGLHFPCLGLLCSLDRLDLRPGPSPLCSG